jgi:hypothetical protein
MGDDFIKSLVGGYGTENIALDEVDLCTGDVDDIE